MVCLQQANVGLQSSEAIQLACSNLSNLILCIHLAHGQSTYNVPCNLTHFVMQLTDFLLTS